MYGTAALDWEGRARWMMNGVETVFEEEQEREVGRGREVREAVFEKVEEMEA